MKKPTNTTEDIKQRVERGDASVLMEGFPGMIEASERRGQAELVASESLPTDFNRFGNAEKTQVDRDTLERWGFKLGEPFPDDPMFMPVELPEGWKRVATDHAMHSKIEDAKGRERVSVFYKAASYDRSAHMNLVSRYGVEFEIVSGTYQEKNEVIKHTVVDHQEGTTLEEFIGDYSQTSDDAREYLATFVSEAGSGWGWTE